MKKIIKLESLIHAVMVTFAIASMFNISTYLSSSHDIIMSWALGISLSFGLVGLSIVLSRIDMNNKQLFFKMLAATILVCLLSGLLQTLSYQQHGQNIVLSSIFGFGFPFVAELVLALAISAFDEDRKQQKIRTAGEDWGNKAAIVIADTLSRYDDSLIQNHINDKVSEVVRQKVDSVMDKLLDKNLSKGQNIETKSRDKKIVLDKIDRQNFAQNKTNAHIGTRQSEKIHNFVQHLLDNYDGQNVDDLNKKIIGQNLEISEKTVSRYIDRLRSEKRLNGHVDRKALINNV